jgi:hypothetical protein
MACKKNTTRKYQTRDSPAFHAKDCKGLSKKGNDGLDYISKADTRGVYKWVKLNTGKHYDIHDNGGKPFRVVVDGKTAIIFKQDYDEEADVLRIGKKLLELSFKEIFIGDNDKNQEHYEPKGADKGNTILLKLTDTKYQFIGLSIQTFETIKGENILKYYSPVGNNDVPYPYAVGEKYTYLMIESVYIPIEVLDANEGPYEQYYGYVHKNKNIKKLLRILRKKILQ